MSSDEANIFDQVFGDNLATTEFDILSGRLTNNYLVVEVDTFMHEDLTLKSGITLAVDPTHIVHKYTQRHGKVAKIPEKLVPVSQSVRAGMSWETQIEIEVGDEVWFYGMACFGGEKFSFKGKKYVLLSYEDLYVAKRGERIVCLNGNVLLKPVYNTVEALSYSKQELDQVYAEVAYIGLKNTSYAMDGKDDCDELSVGMKVILPSGAVRYLEQEPYLHFDGTSYVICQNHEINGYLS